MNSWHFLLMGGGGRFIADAANNAKNPLWGSRLNIPRGRAVRQAKEEEQLLHLSDNEPRYWPTDANRIPDVLDIFISEGISPRYPTIKTSPDFSYDHTPIYQDNKFHISHSLSNIHHQFLRIQEFTIQHLHNASP